MASICLGLNELKSDDIIIMVVVGFVFSLICVWINGWVNNREAGDLWRYRTHYDVTVMRDGTLFVLRQNIWVFSFKLIWYMHMIREVSAESSHKC